MANLNRFAEAVAARHADLMLLAVAIVWGTSYGVAKGALLSYPVLGFLAVRFLLTFLLLLPALRAQPLKAVLPGIPLGLVLLTIFLCETYGVAITTASNAAFLISLCVVFTPLVEWWVFKHRPPGSALIAAAVSLSGALLLTQAGHIEMNLGDCLMIAAALCRACMVCLTKKLTQHTDVSALALTAVQSGVVGIGSLAVFVLAPGNIPPLPFDAPFWVATVYLVLFGTLFAFFAQNYAVKRTTPTRASLLMGSEPLFGALFAALWLSEQLSAFAWVGGVLIVSASLWASWPRVEGMIYSPNVGAKTG
ncbi:DMT family transporter [Halomonas shantousis]